MVESPPKDAVRELLDRLARVRSPLERMRLLGRAWRQLRGLDDRERKIVADAVGLEGADRLLERIARRKLPVAEVVRALAGADDSDPGALRSLLSDLRDPDGRRELVKRGRELALDHLDPNEPEATVEPGPELETDAEPESTGPQEAQVEPESERGRAEARRDDSVIETESGGPIEVDADVALVREEPVARGADPGTEPVAGPDVRAIVATPTTRSGGDAEPVPALPTPAVDRPTPATRPEQARPEPVTVETARLADARVAPGEDDDPLSLLRSLRSELAADGAIGADELHERVARAGPSWVRRRAVLAAIDRGVLTRWSELERLLEVLERPSDRRWCILAFLDRGDPTSDELDRLSRDESDPVVRRRAVRRLETLGS